MGLIKGVGQGKGGSVSPAKPTHLPIHNVTRALKCRTLGGCRLTNALSRQLALLAEPKNPLDSTMSTSSGFFVHTMKHCYATALYTTATITHARISLPHARAIMSVVYIRKECGK